MQNIKQYASLVAKIKELEAQRDQLKIEIVSEMEKKNETKSVTDYGTFTRANRASWKYSDAIATMEEKVKVAKIKEQQKGIAKMSETEYLVFTPVKG